MVAIPLGLTAFLTLTLNSPRRWITWFQEFSVPT